MISFLRLFLFPLVFGFSSQQALAHGCPVQPDESMIYEMGVDAQLFWQYGPEVGDQSVLFVELKRPGTAVPTTDQFEPEIRLESPEGLLGATPRIDPVFSETGQVKNGEFRVSQLDFPVAGSWKLHMKLKDLTGFEEAQSVVVEICAARARTK